MRVILLLILLCLIVQPRAAGAPYSGASFGGRAGFRSASPSPSYSAPRFSAPRYSAPSIPRYSAPAPRYTAPASSWPSSRSTTWSRPYAAPATHTVIVEHHHYNTSTPWIVYDRADYSDPVVYQGGGCSSRRAVKDAGRDRPVQFDGGADR